MSAETAKTETVKRLPLDNGVNYPIPAEDNRATRQVEVLREKNRVHFTLDLNTEVGPLYFAQIIFADTFTEKLIGVVSYNEFLASEKKEKVSALEIYLRVRYRENTFDKNALENVAQQLTNVIYEYLQETDHKGNNEILFPIKNLA